MNNELSKKLMAIVLRRDIEVWIESERAERLKIILISMTNQNKFIEIDNEVINTADIVGIFDANTMENAIRRRNGMWQDKKGGWHDRGVRICRCGNEIPPGKQCGNCI